MSEKSVFSARDRWFTISVGALLLIGAVAAAVGFLWLPRAHGTGAAGLWDAICSAAGAPARFQSAALPSEQAVFPTSVVVTSEMMGPAADSRAIGHGATLALNCTMCHGARGMSPAGTPNLAAQPASATYKQLRDFKSGHRKSAIMQPLVLSLNDEDMRDLSAYFASLPREPLLARTANLPVPRLVSNGSPMRNVGACASCHSAVAPRAATPVLDGLPETYLRAQLQAFRTGGRANDINRQMRNATHQLTPQEMDVLARYYASR
jgi:cytochrome c553